MSLDVKTGDMRKKSKLPSDVPAATTGQGVKSTTSSNNTKSFFILVAVMVILVGVLSWAVHRPKPSNCQQSTTQSCQVLKDAVKQLAPSQAADLAKTVDQIKTVKGYDKNPNLLYVLTAFYINRSDAQSSRKYVNLLKTSYKSKVGYDPLLSKPPINVKNPTDLEKDVAFVERLNQNLKANFSGVPPR